jgi:hypothetical protein
MLTPQQRRTESEYAARIIAQANNGLMGCAIADPTATEDHDNKPAPAGY